MRLCGRPFAYDTIGCINEPVSTQELDELLKIELESSAAVGNGWEVLYDDEGQRLEQWVDLESDDDDFADEFFFFRVFQTLPGISPDLARNLLHDSTKRLEWDESLHDIQVLRTLDSGVCRVTDVLYTKTRGFFGLGDKCFVQWRASEFRADTWVCLQRNVADLKGVQMPADRDKHTVLGYTLQPLQGSSTTEGGCRLFVYLQMQIRSYSLRYVAPRLTTEALSWMCTNYSRVCYDAAKKPFMKKAIFGIDFLLTARCDLGSLVPGPACCAGDADSRRMLRRRARSRARESLRSSMAYSTNITEALVDPISEALEAQGWGKSSSTNGPGKTGMAASDDPTTVAKESGNETVGTSSNSRRPFRIPKFPRATAAGSIVKVCGPTNAQGTLHMHRPEQRQLDSYLSKQNEFIGGTPARDDSRSQTNVLRTKRRPGETQVVQTPDLQYANLTQSSGRSVDMQSRESQETADFYQHRREHKDATRNLSPMHNEVQAQMLKGQLSQSSQGTTSSAATSSAHVSQLSHGAPPSIATIAFALSKVHAARRHAPPTDSQEAVESEPSSETGSSTRAENKKAIAMARLSDFGKCNVDHESTSQSRSCGGPDAVRLYRTVSTVCGGTTPAFRASLQLLHALTKKDPSPRAPSESSGTTAASGISNKRLPRSREKCCVAPPATCI